MHELNMSDGHYLRAVTELGDTRKIIANCDIHSQNGIKLVAAGIQVTSKLYGQLVNHKLLPGLDKALTVENMLNPEHVLDDMFGLIEGNVTLAKVADVISKGNSYRQIVGDIPLPSPLAFKLTVAKEKFPRIYQHSLMMMAVSIYLARCDSMRPDEEAWVAMAALFHDIGLMHIDPRMLEPLHVMSPAERRHLYAHPLTAYLLLSEFSELPKPVANAVLEHHERMDGSGYPRGLHGEKISRYGQILAITEVAAKAFDSDKPGVPWKKLDVTLKLNSRRFGQGLIGHLNIFRDNVAGTTLSVEKPEKLVEQVNLIAKLFDDFNRYSDPLYPDPIFDFAQIRLAGLRLSLFEAGFDPCDPEGLIQTFMEDPECMAEYAPLVEEAIWQFKSMVLAISRQWPETVEKNVREKSERSWLREMKSAL